MLSSVEIGTLMTDPSAPKVTVTRSQRIRKPLPLPPFMFDTESRPPIPDPNKLQLSFQTKLDEYNEALKSIVSEPLVINDCEDNLCDIIRNFSNPIYLSPIYYAQTVKLKAIQSMIELLKDNNCSIGLATSILVVFKELTRFDILVAGQEEKATALVKSLVCSLDVFVSALGKFSQEEDFVFLVVQTIAQMIFLVPSLAETVVKTELITWVSTTFGAPGWNFPKKHVVGLLDTLLVSNIANRLQLGTMGFVTVVLNALSSLLKPYDEGEEVGEEENLPEDEEDYLLGTLFRSLLLLLEASENKERFANAEGVQLMIKFIQNMDLRYGYCGTAIEALDIAVKGCQSACNKFVNDVLGLDIAFSAFMDKTPPSFTHEKEEIREHLISLIASLTGGTAKTENNILLKKFEENDCEIITWLMGLFLRYLKQVEERQNSLEDKQMDESALYNEKLRYGLSTLQSIAVILGYLWSFKNHTIIAARMSRYKAEKQLVHNILSAYRDHTGNAGESSAEKTVIDEYIDSLEENPDQWMEQIVETGKLVILTDDDILGVTSAY